MVKCYCDLCEKETNSKEYIIPIMNKDDGFHAVNLQLCEDCRNKFNNLIKDSTTPEVYKRLQNSELEWW